MPPRRGQHTREVLAQAGLDARAIDAMLSEGAASEPSLDGAGCPGNGKQAAQDA